MDMLMTIYNALMEDDVIATEAGGRIKFYEYPESGSMTDPHIVIDPLDVPKPSDYADNKWMTEDYPYQIDVWTKSRSLTAQLAGRVQDVMWDALGFYQNGGMDEWDKETGIYRDARRYRGKAYVDTV